MATGRPCSVCTHDQRDAIDRALVSGVQPVAVSKQFDIGKQALLRHRAAHIPTPDMHAGAQAVAADEALHGAALLSKAASLLRTAETILGDAITDRDPATALKAIREAGRMVELCAKLTGDLDESTTVNLVLAPQWITLQSTILLALAPHPEARSAVVAALGRVQ